jgi:hypothetical protein
MTLITSLVIYHCVPNVRVLVTAPGIQWNVYYIRIGVVVECKVMDIKLIKCIVKDRVYLRGSTIIIIIIIITNKNTDEISRFSRCFHRDNRCPCHSLAAPKPPNPQLMFALRCRRRKLQAPELGFCYTRR